MQKQTEIAPGIAVEAGRRFTKPVLIGTKVGVSTILERVAAGHKYSEIEVSLGITRGALLAALSYATEIVAEERTSVLKEPQEGSSEIALGITADRRVRFGKPVLKGTRLDVTTLLGHLSAGETPEEVAQAYNVPVTAVLAAVAYTHGIVDRETVSAL